LARSALNLRFGNGWAAPPPIARRELDPLGLTPFVI